MKKEGEKNAFPGLSAFLEGANFSGGLPGRGLRKKPDSCSGTAAGQFAGECMSLPRVFSGTEPRMRRSPEVMPGLGRERKAGRCRHEEWEIYPLKEAE